MNMKMNGKQKKFLGIGGGTIGGGLLTWRLVMMLISLNTADAAQVEQIKVNSEYRIESKKEVKEINGKIGKIETNIGKIQTSQTAQKESFEDFRGEQRIANRDILSAIKAK